MEKQHFLHVKLHSIPHSLTNDIIKNYDDLKLFFKMFKQNKTKICETLLNQYNYTSLEQLKCNHLISSYNTSSFEDNNSNVQEYKIIYFLFNELINNLYTYNFKHDGIMKNINHYHISNLFLNKENKDQENTVTFFPDKKYIYFDSKQPKITTKKLFFIWFLNDYENEIQFWNNYSIKPKKGMLLLYPASWVFPLHDYNITNNEIIYYISGNICEQYALGLMVNG